MPIQSHNREDDANSVLESLANQSLNDALKDTLELGKVKDVKLDELRTNADLDLARIQQLVKDTRALVAGERKGQVKDDEGRILDEVKSKSNPPRVLLGVKQRYKVTDATVDFDVLIHRFETNYGAEGYFEHLLREDKSDLSKWNNRPMLGSNPPALALGHLALVKGYDIIMWCHNNFLFKLDYGKKNGRRDADEAELKQCGSAGLLQFASKIERHLKEGTVPGHVEGPKPEVKVFTPGIDDPKDGKYYVALKPLDNAKNFVLAEPPYPQLRESVALELQSKGMCSFQVYVADKKTLVILDRYTVDFRILTPISAAG
ncbi:hypothetical protein B0T26DRAFT_672256 [Lasiosphaeria miniovina]|uniref:Uncharacterized protein n=1 Tax=Lasiosphaeria miniovina TaxID=1954250 RepID=A0AA40E781_9PEZI|nr:uncharacterized protein B0T26DRAFT_672256 [Lasiosphaeria miniovina]KAK0727612.1 hypothetical protein B0T26DRAFT_672256 [Lasiosphaeria miniovina]